MFSLFWALLLGILLTGCRERSVPPPIEISPTPPPDVSLIPPVTTEPRPILDQMVAAYQSAISYSDCATVQIIGKMSQPNTEPAPWNCTVAFQKPNRLRLEIYEGIFVSDGEDCYAQIQPLPDQVLHSPSPEQWTLETLFQDVHLDNALELGLPPSVLRFPPQLILLFANNPLNTLCPKGAKIECLGQQHIEQISCDVIQISHSDGNRILWISRENQALLRLDYQPVGLPVPEGFESIEAIRIELTNVQFNGNFVPETFQMLQPQNAIQVAQFRSNTPGLSSPEEHRRRLKLMEESDCYRLIDQHIESVIPSEQPPPPKMEPRTFSLSPVWTLPLIGVDTMEFLPGKTPTLHVPYEGNLTAILDLQGNVLQRGSPEGLEDSIIVSIKGSDPSGSRRIGILTLDGEVYLFDESLKPLANRNKVTEKNKTEKIRDFLFASYKGSKSLLLAVQPDSAQENAATNGILRAVDSQGVKRWEYSFEGIPNQVESATVDNQSCILVSRSLAEQDSILVFSSEGSVRAPVVIPFGRHIRWFHVLDSTIYTLLEYADTGDVRFVGFDRSGSGLWSRLLPSGEYEADPVYVSKEKKWLVPSPDGTIFVFDLIGNMIEAFSLNVVPTKLFFVDTGNETLLMVADGETISAWRVY